MRAHIVLRLIFVVCISAAACGGKGKPDTPLGAAGANQEAKIDRTKCEPSGKQVVVADTNRDQKPDVWKLYQSQEQGGQKLQILTCKQVDLNYDSKLDVVYHYDQGGALTFEEFDLDFDGRFDLWSYYQNGKKIREEMDTNYDRRHDFTKYYENEKLVRIERDTNHDGRIDEWQYFEGGKLDRIGYDTTGSGRVDKWDRAPETDLPAAGGSGGESPAVAPPAKQ